MSVETFGLLVIMGTTLAGIIAGYILCYIFLVPKTFGTLRIDHTNPERDIYRIDIDELDKLSGTKKIVLHVDNHANLSQK